MDDEPKRPVAMCLTELNSCEDDAMDHGFRPMFEADDMQVVAVVAYLSGYKTGHKEIMFHPAFDYLSVCLSVC